MCWVSCPDLLSSLMVEPAIYCKEKPLHMESRDPWRSLMYESLQPDAAVVTLNLHGLSHLETASSNKSFCDIWV